MSKPVKTIVLLLLASLLLAACNAAPNKLVEAAPASTAVEEAGKTSAAASPTDEPVNTASELPAGEKKTESIVNLRQEDDQGAVIVVVTPLELSQADDTLQFDVVMDTHSVDLSMDLSVLATLTTDTGKSVTPSQWDAPMGGHHVSGKLIFPAVLNDAPVLEGAAAITLVLRDVDAPERVFTWPLSTE